MGVGHPSFVSFHGEKVTLNVDRFGYYLAGIICIPSLTDSIAAFPIGFQGAELFSAEGMEWASWPFLGILRLFSAHKGGQRHH